MEWTIYQEGVKDILSPFPRKGNGQILMFLKPKSFLMVF